MNKQQEILLVNLQSFEERYFAVPGGGLEQGESLDDAAYREIQEELGIKKESLELVSASKESVFVKFKNIKLNRDGNEFIGSERYFLGFVSLEAMMR